MKLKKIAALLAIAGISAPALATNGLNMEGYGPVATAMGGASMAYDNGTAGLINNPATLGLMKSGTSRFDLAIGGLHPDVTTKVQGMFSSDSAGDAYYMPAIGYVRKDGKVTWGIGMMSQGGMGTEWGRSSVLSAGGIGAFGAFGATGLEQRTELGIGRVMVPLTFDVSDTVRVGGTVDYLWGGMDMQMALDGNTFGAMTANSIMGGAAKDNANKRAVGYVGSKTNATMAGALAGGFNYGYFNFSEGLGKFSQKLTTSGMAANIGLTWQATPALSVGAVYHARSNLSDMTGTGSMVIGNPGNAGGQMVIPGTLKIVNFQWPETFGVGLAYQANDKWNFVADYKNIAWSNVFQQFHMIFTSAAMGGLVGEFGMNLNWKDQHVVQLGASYKMDDTTTLRFGASLANQMVEEANLIPLFPAVTTNHFTVGAGFALSKASTLDFSLAHAPRVSVTKPGLAANAPFNVAGPAVSAGMAQTNWQLMFSQRF